jgi:hypothetical protein
MSQYIICYGWHGTHRVIDAASIHEAHKLAIRKSFRAGILDPDDMRETTWAAPYSEDLAEQLDLLPYEPVWLENHVRG